MGKLSTVSRISIGLALLTASALLTADFIGLIPSQAQMTIDGRKKFCESLAVQCAVSAQKDDMASILATMRLVVEREKDILSAAVRRSEGKILAEAGDHRKLWTKGSKDQSAFTHAEVPIFRGGTRWGTVEIRFAEIGSKGLLGLGANSPVKLVLFVTLMGFVAHLFFLKRSLRQLDPSSVVPKRVKAALDTLSEGVVLLDKQERIVLANSAFASRIGLSAQKLLGRKASDLAWAKPKSQHAPSSLPWIEAMQKGQNQTGVALDLPMSSGGTRTFMVNSAPITDDQGNSRGALASFDDMTELERRNTQLEEALDTLEKSRDEVRRQNSKLQLLATHDSLTKCLNRRAFLERLEASLASSKRHGHAVSCIMVDIDHFKAVNDSHGHGVGDQVLQRVAETLQSVSRKNSSLCRFGGEEFCIILPYANTQSGMLAARRLRHAVELQVCAGINVTVSIGVASTESGVDNPTELLDQADKALYLAKNTGRNRVASAEEVSAAAGVATDQNTSTTEAVDTTNVPRETIRLDAVSALMSAMEQRDPETAEHCRHTAELCVAMAEGLMPPSECFCVEVAGLLHDIGKIGVPDTILRKPAQLTETERKIMHEHDRMGAEIVASAFPSPTLAKIVRSHHTWYSSNTLDPTMPVGKDIPLGARILTMADAFSAMVSNRPYRKKLTYEDAFAELRRCAGRQFDPDLVERFIEIVSVRAKSEDQTSDSLSQTVKLGIGREAQRLATAVGLGDYPEVALIAGRLAVDAHKEGLGLIAEVASDIEREASTNCDQRKIVSLATDLMGSCGLNLAELATAGGESGHSPKRFDPGHPSSRVLARPA